MNINQYVGAVWTAASSWSCGYGQGDGVGGRWDIRPGGAGDCSSITIWGAQMGGYPTGGASYTGDMRAELTSVGWAEVPIGQPSKGDILWKTGHVAVCVDDGANLSEAWINENNDIIGGAPGDQTGQETRTIGYWEHPFTQSGAWEVILRPPAAYPAGGWSMELPLTDGAVRPPAQPRRPGGSVAEAAAWQASQTAPAPSAPQGADTRTTLLGIDIANYQAGIDLAAVNPDFVIVQVTRGTTGLNTHWHDQAMQAWNQGRPLGLYHYIQGEVSAEAEADLFAATISSWLGYAMICVDWEEPDNAAWGDEGYLRRFLTRLSERVDSRWLMLYAPADSYPWGVATQFDTGRWVAQYADSEPTGWDADPWHGQWPMSAHIHQYTGTGRVSGYPRDLDLDVFHGSAADWRRYYTTDHTDPGAGASGAANTQEDELSAATDTVNTISSLLHDHLAPAIGQMARESYATNARTEKMAADIAAMHESIDKLVDALAKKEG